MTISIDELKKPFPNYTIIEGFNLIDFIKLANKYIESGYSPQGGVSVICVSHDRPEGHYEHIFYQAMIKPPIKAEAALEEPVLVRLVPAVESSPAKPGSSPFDAG